MEIESLRELIKEKFNNDPLWNQIMNAELNDYLFPEDLLKKLNTNTTYSLVQAAEILDVKDHNLRNYLNRHYLSEYIEPEKFGKMYRLDYKCIFKFHMIFTLVNYGKRTPSDIATYVGTKVEVGHTSKRIINREAPINEPFGLSNESNIGNELIENKLKNIEKHLLLINWERVVDQSKNEMEKSLRLVSDWEKEVTLLGHEIENLELKKQIKKQEQRSLDLVKESYKKTGMELSKNTGFSFKSLFSKNKPEHIDYDKVIDEIAISLESKISNLSGVESLDNEINKLRTRMDKLQTKKEELFKLKEEKEKQYKEQYVELEKFKLTLGNEFSGQNILKTLAGSLDNVK